MTLCWWCMYNTNSNLSLPIKYNNQTNTFECIGTFCSWECMKAYNLYDQNNMKHIRSSYITMMYRHLNDKNDYIKPAPKRELLDIFGGPLSRKQFTDKSYDYVIMPTILSVQKLNIDKQINYKWVDHNNASVLYESTTNKNNVNPMKIKNEDRDKTSKGILAFSSFVK